MSDPDGERRTSLAERFLEEVRDSRTVVSVYLANGYQLKGHVIDFDRDSVLFKHKGAHQLVMRSAVASMYPTEVRSQDGEEWWRAYAPAAVEP